MTCKDKVSRREGGMEDGRIGGREEERRDKSHRKFGGLWCQIKAE